MGETEDPGKPVAENPAKPLRPGPPVVSFSSARKRLAMLWGLCGGAIFVVFLIQSFGIREDLQSDWAWFLPNLFPTLTLIVSAVALNTFSKRPKGSPVNVSRFVFWVTWGLSLFYLLLLLATILIDGASRSVQDAKPILDVANLWLAPVQTLVGISLGIFFASGQSQ